MQLNRFLLIAAMALPMTATAQGTLTDYNRAYDLRNKFTVNNVYHQASDIRWNDDTSVLSYAIYTPQGRRYITYDTQTRQRNEYAHEDSMRMALGLQSRQRPATQQFGRRRQRHWMEVDEENNAYPVTSPDNKYEAYIEGYNVVLHEKGKPYSDKRILSQDGTLGDYYSNRIYWSPNSRYIFVCRRQPVEKRYVYYVESSPKDQLQPILHKQEYAKPGDKLPFRTPVIFDTQTGRQLIASTDLCSHQYDLNGFTWTADSKEVIFEYNERGHKVYRVLAMDVTTGKIRTVVEEKANTFVNYSRQYRQYLKDNKMIWMSERDNWNHLYLVDINKGKIERQITKGNWCVRNVIKVDEEKGCIYFSASGVNPQEDPYYIHYYRIAMDGSKLTDLTPARGNHSAVFNKDFTYLTDTYSEVDKAPVTELRSATNGTLITTLERADITPLIHQGWRAPEVFTAKARDGKTDIWGIIQRPTNFDPNKKYPVIEYIYAGPGDAYTPKNFMIYNWNMTSLAELGFIVVQMDGMGTGWRGKKFEDVCYKNLKDAGFPDRMLWIKAAAAKYPYMDIERVGIFGASAGGQESTTAVLLHGDFYKAAYSACGCHDNRMDKIWWNEQWMGYPIDSSYVASSNVYNANKLQRPLMLVVGELDDNVDPASTYQVADALIRANKDFELVVLPGAHHTMGELYGEHKRYDFFVKNLMHVLPPQWSDVKTGR